MKPVAPVFILVIALAACGGGGQSGTVVPNVPAAPTGSKTASVALTIAVPRSNPQSAVRRPAYVSPATESIVVTPQGATSQTFATTQSSPGCTNSAGSLTCTFSVSAPVGPNEPIRISTYAKPDGSGSPLSTATVTVNVVAGQNNPINATVNGVVASLSVVIVLANFVPGTASIAQVIVNALDASGNTIVGPGSYADANGNPVTVQLSDSDSSNSTTLSQTTVTQPTSGITLTYNGTAAFSGATVRSAASNGPAAANIVTANNTAGFVVTGSAATQRFVAIDQH
ncbi:MAG: hypothetical protein M3N13_10330, partial [Candidatus Eremiobacteraeota bacterium]|nr:hypothetical protein [Candidatus Eremiobacteraeota bacterium]